MRRTGLLALLALGALLGQAHGDEAAGPANPVGVASFEREHKRTFHQKLGLMYGVVASGLASTAVGIALVVPASHDYGYRVAGGVTLGFGAINLLLGSASIPGLVYGERQFDRVHDSRTTIGGLTLARRNEARAERRQTILFAINAGLDGGYVLGGVAAIVASRLGVDHPDRWLGGGIGIAAQGILALAVDVTATVIATSRQATILESLTPVLSIAPGPAGTRTSVGFGGRF